MNAVDVIETLLRAGVETKKAFETSRAEDGTIDWHDFISSGKYQQVITPVKALIDTLTQNDISEAIERVRKKQKDFLRGRKINELPIDELLQFGSLADAESLLVCKEIREMNSGDAFLQWLVKDGLPKLVSIAKTVVPLLV